MKQQKPGPDIIPVHRLEAATPLGIEVHQFLPANVDLDSMGVHRDDHYVFLFQQSGYCELALDFKNMVLSGSTILFVRPGQVHHILRAEVEAGWFLAIDPSLVHEKYRTLFEEIVISQQPQQQDAERAMHLDACATILLHVYQRVEESSINYTTVHSLATAFIGLIAEIYQSAAPQSLQQNKRPEIITRQFRKLLGQEFRTLKNPSDYASRLCLSLSYLNEAVRAVTGWPVSYWIQQEVVLEAKRLLYYSELTVKEIAFALGYEDHSYFSRLFTKVAGQPALGFRRQSRE